MATSDSKPIQESGRPGGSSAIYGGVKRHRDVSESSDTSESDTLLKHRGPKRQRLTSEIEGTLELSELYSYVENISSDDVPKPVIDDNPSEEDVGFMRQAREVSMKSPDESTKVGAIIVDSNTKKVLGEGWNRMPVGCEDRFAWSKGDDDILKTKYPYVLHGVKAAILDALKRKADLNGATLYSTLIPDHNDSQIIREVGITRVVYEKDKYSKYAFTIASKKILEGLDWRQMKMPVEKATRTDLDSD